MKRPAVPLLDVLARTGREIGESLAMAFNPEIMRNMQRAAEMMKAGDARVSQAAHRERSVRVEGK